MTVIKTSFIEALLYPAHLIWAVGIRLKKKRGTSQKKKKIGGNETYTFGKPLKILRDSLYTPAGVN